MQKRCFKRIFSVFMVFAALFGFVTMFPPQKKVLACEFTSSAANGPAAHFEFGEAVGETAACSSLKNNSGTLVNKPASTVEMKYTIRVDNTSIPSGDDFLIPQNAVFDKKAGNRHDVFVKTALSEGHLKKISNGGYTLNRGMDYDVNGNISIIKKEYLSGLEEGKYQLAFEYDLRSVSFGITVIDSAISNEYIKVDTNNVIKTFDTNPVALVSFYLTCSDEKPIYQNRVRTFSEAVAEMGISSMRFPYGHLANNYLWTTDPFNPVDKNGKLMPRLASVYAKPSPLADRDTWGWLVNDDGTFDKSMDFDEYVAICKTNNIEPLVVINILSKTYREGPTEDELLNYAVEWVRYANKTKGYGVKYWQIGNEAENHARKIPLYEYKRIYKRFAEAMKAVDNTIHTGTSFNYSRSWMDSFHQEENLKPLIDFTAAHQYTFGHGWAKNYETWKNNIGAGEGNVNNIVASVKNHIPGTPIFITETNVYGGSWETIENETYKALAWFDMLLNTISKENVKYSYFWTVHNAWRGQYNFNNHAAALDIDNSFLPKGRILKITSHNLEDQLVYAERAKGYVRTYAARSSVTNDLTVFLLNKDDKPVNADVFLKGYNVTNVAERGVFKGTDAWDTEPVYAKTSVSKVKLNQGRDTLSTTLDPVSLTVVKLKGTNSLQSNDADLKGLSFDKGTLSPAFDAGTTEYDLTVDSSIGEISFIPTTAAPASTIKIEVSAASGTGHSMNNKGKLEIEVKAEDGTIKTYIINIKNKYPRLDGIIFNKGSINRSFDPGITSYTLEVNYSNAHIDITPLMNDIFESITVGGQPAVPNEKTVIDLVHGNNFVEIVITQPDGLKNAYIINVYRPLVPDTNAELSNIEVSEGTLTFDPGVKNYTMSVTNNVKSMDIIPTASSDAAALTVNGESKISGEAYTVTFTEDVTAKVDIVVTAEDKTVETYSIAITRLGPSIDEGMVVHYKLDERDGTAVKDSSGKGNDGILKNGSGWTGGKVGGGLDLDGIDDYISLANPLGNDARELSFSTWLYLDQKNGTTMQTVISQEGAYGVVWLFRSERAGAENKFQSWLLKGNDSISKYDCPVGKWVHVTYVYSYKSNESKFYINGEFDSSSTASPGQKIYGGKLRIGAHKTPNTAKEEWDGKIDDFRIYNRPLSDAEVRMLYEYNTR